MQSEFESEQFEGKTISAEFRQRVRAKIEHEIRSMADKEVEDFVASKISTTKLQEASHTLAQMILRGVDDALVTKELRKLTIDITDKSLL